MYPIYIPREFQSCEFSVGGVDHNGRPIGTHFGASYATAKRFYREQRRAGGRVSLWECPRHGKPRRIK
jgi:hypothetical protein